LSIDKQKIARSFSRAATTYDQVAHLQRSIEAVLLQSCIPLLSSQRENGILLDLGCGTGVSFPQLNQLFFHYDYMGIDLSEGMLSYARQHRQLSAPLMVGDAERLPLSNGSVSAIYSNLALQWCNHLDTLMAELYRVLSSNGYLVFSTLGPTTLHELKYAWQQVDQHTHVNRFYDQITWQQAFMQAGFFVKKQYYESRVLFYDQALDLMRELKALGAHNVTASPGLHTKHYLSAVLSAYETLRCQQGLPATYEVYYWVLGCRQ